MYFIITNNGFGGLPDDEYCSLIRDGFNLEMPVLYDPSGVFPSHIGVGSPNDWHVVLDGEGKIVVKDSFSNSSAFSAINDLLQ